MTDADPPEGYSQWNGRLLAEKLGNGSDDQVWRVLRKHKIQLQRRRSWCISTDSESGPKAADVVSLYLSHRKMRCSAWRKGLTFRRWRELWGGCASPTAKRLTDSALATKRQTAAPFEWTKAVVSTFGP